VRQYISQMLGGPGHLRFFLQPIVAVALGLIHGRRDRAAGRPPYLFALASSPGDRGRHLREGLRDVLVPLCIALAASLLFQHIITKRLHPLLALSYAAIFVALPYFVTRALANRLATRWHRPVAH
jgi:hypothetical protein